MVCTLSWSFSLIFTDLTNPKTNKKNAGFTPEEREGFGRLLEAGPFIDSFRCLYPDKEQAYTFWSNFRQAREKNIGWSVSENKSSA